ncbi:hypothetical protein DFH06DRAFT_1303945 [Mycena polygramma]|nr:hypothetical protein DFH06DRAFT_1303945 [Mycena polygramma]
MAHSQWTPFRSLGEFHVGMIIFADPQNEAMSRSTQVYGQVNRQAEPLPQPPNPTPPVLKPRPCLVINVDIDEKTLMVAPFTSVHKPKQRTWWVDLNQPGAQIQFEWREYSWCWVGEPTQIDIVLNDSRAMHHPTNPRWGEEGVRSRNLAAWTMANQRATQKEAKIPRRRTSEQENPDSRLPSPRAAGSSRLNPGQFAAQYATFSGGQGIHHSGTPFTAGAQGPQPWDIGGPGFQHSGAPPPRRHSSSTGARSVQHSGAPLPRPQAYFGGPGFQHFGAPLPRPQAYFGGPGFQHFGAPPTRPQAYFGGPGFQHFGAPPTRRHSSSTGARSVQHSGAPLPREKLHVALMVYALTSKYTQRRPKAYFGGPGFQHFGAPLPRPQAYFGGPGFQHFGAPLPRPQAYFGGPGFQHFGAPPTRRHSSSTGARSVQHFGAPLMATREKLHVVLMVYALTSKYKQRRPKARTRTSPARVSSTPARPPPAGTRRPLAAEVSSTPARPPHARRRTSAARVSPTPVQARPPHRWPKARGPRRTSPARLSTTPVCPPHG